MEHSQPRNNLKGLKSIVSQFYEMNSDFVNWVKITKIDIDVYVSEYSKLHTDNTNENNNIIR